MDVYHEFRVHTMLVSFPQFTMCVIDGTEEPGPSEIPYLTIGVCILHFSELNYAVWHKIKQITRNTMIN